MDELIKEASRFKDLTTAFTLWEALLAMFLAFAMSLIIAKVYHWTHSGVSYSRSFAQTLVIMAVVVATVMLIIGSNIARAFTLVGALSIIRFRNPIKDSRDVAFIFVAMAIGMSVGTGFYATALIFTLFAAFMVYVLSRFNIGSAQRREMLLKVIFPADADYQTAFNELFYQQLREHALLSVEPLGNGDTLELVYSIEFRSQGDHTDFLTRVRDMARGGRVALLTGHDQIDV